MRGLVDCGCEEEVRSYSAFGKLSQYSITKLYRKQLQEIQIGRSFIASAIH